MGIINKNSEEIKKYRRYGTGADAFVRVYDSRMYFTESASKMCGMQIGDFVHFINDGLEWCFYVNDDKDGFLVSQGQNGRKSYKDRDSKNICNVGLIRLFRATTGFSHDTSFVIEKTNAFHDKCSIFIIKTDKPII